jgi:aminopeptidase N
LRSTRLCLSILLLVTFGLLGPSSAPARGPSEPFFPGQGNRGYDIGSYEVDLDYRGPRSVATSTYIDMTAKRRLSRVVLDFLGPEKVRGEGPEPGSFRRRGGKLIYVPGTPIAAGSVFTLYVNYRGVPPTITDPDGSQEGWYPTNDGVIAVGEPKGTAAWIPCNDTPADKATFRFTITVPRSLKAVANGRLSSRSQTGNFARFIWAEPKPMSTYLAVLNIGRGRLVKGGIGTMPTWSLVDPRLERDSRRPLSALPEVVGFLSDRFGSYPFNSAGSIVDYAPSLGYALETQSRPVYAFAPDLTTLVHETAHQWFGDAVGIERWPQIWLNEGFATWIEWYYAEHHGGRSAHAILERLLRVPASKEGFWNPPPGRPTSAKQLFDSSIYVRGAMALQALREKIGTTTMLRLLRRWVAGHRYGNATTEDFIALAERVSGRDLGGFFRRWLYRPGKP